MSGAMAQSKDTISMVVGFPPGTSVDLVARQVAKDITDNGGPNIIVENKPGANQGIAASDVVNATQPKLFFYTNGLYLNALLTKTLPIDLQTQLKPIAVIGTQPLILATKFNSNITNIKDIKKYKKEELTYGSNGVGSINHVIMEQFASQLNQSLTHVPYPKGNSILDLVAGRTDLEFTFYSTSKGFVQDQRIRVLAVTSDARMAELPTIPTLKEQGINLPMSELTYIVGASTNIDSVIANDIQRRTVNAISTNGKSYQQLGLQLNLNQIAQAEKTSQALIKKVQLIKLKNTDQ